MTTHTLTMPTMRPTALIKIYHKKMGYKAVWVVDEEVYSYSSEREYAVKAVLNYIWKRLNPNKDRLYGSYEAIVEEFTQDFGLEIVDTITM